MFCGIFSRCFHQSGYSPLCISVLPARGILRALVGPCNVTVGSDGLVLIGFATSHYPSLCSPHHPHLTSDLSRGHLSVQICLLPGMSSIQFASDQIRPVKSNTSAGGVFSTRNASRTSTSLTERLPAKIGDIEEEGNDLKQEGDLKTKQVCRNRVLVSSIPS